MAILLGTVILAAGNLFPFWQLRLNAPQYPGGLFVTIYTHGMTGDVREVDGLNHYIGMMPLGDAASLERAIAMPALAVIVIFGILAVTLRHKLSVWFAVPVILFPLVFAADLYFWLYRAGHNLDPTAALSSSIKPFTPAIVGRGVVGQFSTDGMFQTGFWLALVGAAFVIAGIAGRLRQSSGRAR
jgi:hypothetical protein